MPRFVYLNHTDVYGNKVDGVGWIDFVGPYPGPKLFPTPQKGYAPPSSNEEVNVWSSNQIMSPPFHTTIILETFYLSNQTDADVDNLEDFYIKLHKWHDFLHTERVVSNCVETSTTQNKQPSMINIPCVLVQHPWETDIEMKSVLWEYALRNVTQIVADEGWTPTVEIPFAVKSLDYPGDEAYKSLLYLLQCLSNVKSQEKSNNKETSSNDMFLSSCPFQLIDVGVAAALSKADQDLIQIGQILMDKNRIKSHSWSTMEVATERAHVSKESIQHLWSSDEAFFFNSMVELTVNVNGTYSSNYTTPMTMPLASSFTALWDDTSSNSTILESFSSHLLQYTGQYSFYCGDHPLWSIGGCNEPDAPYISTLLNYRLSKGLRHNKLVSLAHFIESSTLNLIGDHGFASMYNATSPHLPIGEGEFLTSTLTASILIDMLNKDKSFRYASEPPISSSSVVFLIGLELVLAFGIGVICLLLSLNLMRRATADEEGDEFVNLIAEQQPEEELLVQSPLDNSNITYANESLGQWSVELISRFIPTSLWGESRDTQQHNAPPSLDIS